MPEIGEIQYGRNIGYSKQNAVRFIWFACGDCGKRRWVVFTNGEPRNSRCQHCANILKAPQQMGEKSACWKGGRKRETNGYISVYAPSDDFFISMANSRHYIPEHRLVMAKHLGRCLQRWELVHHKGTKYPKGSIENKQDNRIENLQLVTDERHQQITILETRIAYLEKRVTLLEAENVVLKQKERV